MSEVVIWRGQDDRGSRVLTAAVGIDGAVTVGGQDLGEAVSAFGEGMREYEWDWRIEGVDVPRAARLLGGSPDDDIVELLRTWTSEHPFRDPGQFLKNEGLDLGFWSRVGD